jgi:uncharacterized protein YyaL (SSP411 family)
MQLLAYFLILAVLLSSGVAHAYHHHASKVRFLEPSPEAFEIARRAQKPVFMYISAVWCYWCKYFDQHALETEEVSSYLNRHYVSIFVDHDRRRDLAQKYVRGLPMIVLFDPDGQVRQSFAGALKKEDFLDVLKRIEGEILTALAKGPPSEPRAGLVATSRPLLVTPETYQQLREGMASFLDEHLDTAHGGFGTGDKHPHVRLLAYLLERYEITRERRYLVAVENSLDGILRGIFDPVEGGFFRYAEGREWRRPHYEKMAYLNASLAAVFDKAHRLTRNPRYKEAAEATLGYLLRTLYDSKAGGFYGSQTADPAYYSLSPEARRTARKPPVNRDKVTAWNAEAALAFLALSQSSGRKDLADAALRTLEFMRRNVLTEKGMFHIYEYTPSRGYLRGQLEANAWAALAFLEGYRVSRNAAYRQAAERVLGHALAQLFDRQRGGFVAGNNPDDKGAGARTKELYLETNAVMAEALLRAHLMTQKAEYLDVARRVLATFGGEVKAILVDDPDASPVRVADTVFFLRAYGQVFASSQSPTSQRRDLR